MDKEHLRHKWGVGRILYETYPHAQPIIIPIHHEGMSDLLPNEPPYYFRFNAKLTFNFGNPIDLSDTMKMIFDKKVDEVEARRIITDVIQSELEVLRKETEKLHNNKVTWSASVSDSNPSQIKLEKSTFPNLFDEFQELNFKLKRLLQLVKTKIDENCNELRSWSRLAILLSENLEELPTGHINRSLKNVDLSLRNFQLFFHF